jgi:uncharacterized membrane protein
VPARARFALTVLFLACLVGAGPNVAAAQESTVHAVLFFSPTCPHCERVLQNVLPNIFAYFGGAPQFHAGTVGHLLTNGKLAILLVDATQPEGQALYRVSGQQLNLPPDRQGVPRLVCGDSVMVGEFEIPDKFPEIIRHGLAHDGVPWPAIPGLASVFPPGFPMYASADSTQAAAGAGKPRVAPSRAAVGATAGGAAAPAESAVTASAKPAAGPTAPARPASQPTTPSTAASQPPRAATTAQPESTISALISRTKRSALHRTFAADPISGSLALVILAGMVLSLVLMPTRLPTLVPTAWHRVVPVLAIAGIGVAAYLAYVDATGASAVCGPFGDCDAVQQSHYARLWGVPVAVLGLAGYVAILATWIGSRAVSGPMRRWAAMAAFVLSLMGTAVSAVLTYLEPFVIGAVCSWCLASAVLMTLLLWLLAPSAVAGEPAAD